MTEGSSLRLDRGPGWEKATAAALDFLIHHRGDRVRGSEIWGAIRRKENLRILVATPDGAEVDRTDDLEVQIAEVRTIMSALHRRARPVESSEPESPRSDPEYQVIR